MKRMLILFIAASPDGYIAKHGDDPGFFLPGIFSQNKTSGIIDCYNIESARKSKLF